MFKLAIISCLVSITVAFEYGNGINDLWANNMIEYDNTLPVMPPVQYPYQPPVAIFPTVPDTIITPKEAALVAAETKVGFISKIITSVFRFVRVGLHFLVKNALALILGSLSALGVCKFTPICTKISTMNSFLDFRRELALVASSDRFIRAAEFVEKAIRKYSGMQN